MNPKLVFLSDWVERLFLVSLLAALALLSLKFPMWGAIALERKLDVYPIVGSDTIAMLDRMEMTLAAFDEACEAHQAGLRDASTGVESYSEGFAYATPEELIEVATDDMYAAVAARKALAQQADWGLVKSLLVGGQVYTHSTWRCAGAYATFTNQITLVFKPTYEPA